MGFNTFNIKIMIRVIGIALFIFLFFFSLSQEKWYVTTAVTLIFIFILLAELVYFINLTNRELSKFLLSLKYKDFSTQYNTLVSKKKSSFDLKKTFHEITTEFQNIRIEKELHYQYLQTVFTHSKTAIICFEQSGEIQLVNEAAKKLLNITRLRNIKEIERINPQLLESIKSAPLHSEKLLKIKINNDLHHLSLQCSLFKLKEHTYQMVSLHDVKNVLEEQELDAWKKLIRVLNHEIMNSVTPISSLSSALNKMLSSPSHTQNKLKELNADDSKDLVESLKVIENRSKGLLKFVTNYKKITKLPQPNFTKVNILGFINHICRLLKSKMEDINIQLEINCAEDLYIKADHELIEQVIINILLNAIEAIQNQEAKKISIHAYDEDNYTYIEVSDNGPGIPDEIIDQILIPFFTTKKNGSGIGLSLSKQIMQLHQGNLIVQSKINEGSTFILKFS